MADVARRTYARNDHGPRSVESRRSTTRSEPSQPRHSTTSSSSPYTLTLTTSPPTSLSPSTPFPTRLLITSPRPSSRSPSLLAVISLCTPSGIPLPAGSLLSSTQKLMDSVSEPTRADLALLSRGQRGEVVGAVGFEGLVVREQGEYRVRVTLARMEGEGWEAVAEVDSGVFRVQGRGVNGVKC